MVMIVVRAKCALGVDARKAVVLGRTFQAGESEYTKSRGDVRAFLLHVQCALTGERQSWASRAWQLPRKSFPDLLKFTHLWEKSGLSPQVFNRGRRLVT